MISEEHKRWNKDKGDQTLRLDYPLTEDSVVFDVGGFKGEWADNIINCYNCNVYIFEPVNDFYNLIVNKFKNNKKVHVFKFGLSNKDVEEEIFKNTDASSVFLKTGEKETINLKDFNEFIKIENIENIDLIKINIEGGEYDLLEGILESNNQIKINNFQVQFHDFIPNCEERSNKIRENILKTHTSSFRYDFIWEGWKK